MTATESTGLKGASAIGRAASQPRRLLRRTEAATYVGVSGSKFDQLVADGRMPKQIKLDGCALWDMRRLDVTIDALADEVDEANPWTGVTIQ